MTGYRAWLGRHTGSATIRLLSNTGFVVGAEMLNRVTRIASALALAYVFDIVTFGLAMAALTTHELVRMFIQNGLGARIVAAGDRELQEIAACVHRLNWLLGGALFVVQSMIAIAVGWHFGSAELAWAIAGLGLVHIIYPFAMARVYLAQRADRWPLIAGVMAVAAVSDNLATAGLALCGFGLWAVVLPKISVALLWVVINRRFIAWRPGKAASAEGMRALIPFGLRVLGVELLAGLRQHGDKAVVGLMLGPAALGIYAFASNIGRGLPQSLSSAFAAIVLPVLRRARENGGLRGAYLQALGLGLATTIPSAGAIALTADWLVPMVFGSKWNAAVPLLVVLALGSVSLPVLNVTSQFLRAGNRTATDLWIGSAVTAAFFGAFFLALPHGLVFASLVASLVQAGVTAVAVAFLLLPVRTAPSTHLRLEATQ